MKQSLAVLFVFVGLVPQGDSAKEELKRLAGAWDLVSFEIDGGKETVKDGRLVIQGQKMTNYIGDKLLAESTFSIDLTKKPKAIDWVSIKPNEGMKSIGIYELDGDTLKICGTDGKERPTGFTPTKKNGWGLSVYKRAKR
jgi:uncharacterized protein (TIGR03067 family)